MNKITITHQRTLVERVVYKKACPYCKERPLKIKTCGDLKCQYTHHILEMRKERKTDRTCPTRTINTVIIS